MQLDSISAVARSHRLTLLARVGAYPHGTVSALLGAGRLFEYWAHEACLMPIATWPLMRRLMAPSHPWWGPIIEHDPQLAGEVMGAIRERGALGSRDFEGVRSGVGMWNNLKPAKRMLEALWSAGDLVVAGRQGFQRLYDLPERVLPAAVLGAPVPDADEVLRELVVRAVRARGALTDAGVVEHWRLRGGTARIRPHADALVSAGILRRLEVDDGGAAVLVGADADPAAAAPAGAVLLSPFDNLLWDRPFAERVFGFRHLIEVYKPAPERRYGYYVLPLLSGDRMVGPGRSQGRPPRRHADRAGVAPRGSLPQHGAARASARPARPPTRPRGRKHLDSLDGLRDSRHPHRPGARPRDGGRGRADLPDLHVCPKGGGRLSLRLRAHAQPHARRAAGVPGLARERAPRLCLRLGNGGVDDRHAPDQPGQRVVCVNDVYGGTYRLFSKVYEPKGYRFTYLSAEQCNTELADHLGDDTALVWLETPTNPLLNIVDLRAASDAAHAVGATVVVDNTFASPYLQRPIEHGADIVVHSTTKYLGGHSDLVGGFAATDDDGIAERLGFLQNSLGGVPGPFDSWLVLRGLKTLAVRMNAHCENAARVVEFLQGDGAVERVFYPGTARPSRPRHRQPPDGRLRRHDLVPRPVGGARRSRSSRVRASGRWPRASAVSRA